MNDALELSMLDESEHKNRIKIYDEMLNLLKNTEKLQFHEKE